MKEWCLEHPWMTFFLAVVAIDSVVIVVRLVIGARRG